MLGAPAPALTDAALPVQPGGIRSTDRACSPTCWNRKVRAVLPRLRAAIHRRRCARQAAGLPVSRRRLRYQWRRVVPAAGVAGGTLRCCRHRVVTTGHRWLSRAGGAFIALGLRLALVNPRVRMKTIGLLGGMSWESTVPYYRLINEGVKARAGRLALARAGAGERRFPRRRVLQHAGAGTGGRPARGRCALA